MKPWSAYTSRTKGSPLFYTHHLGVPEAPKSPYRSLRTVYSSYGHHLTIYTFGTNTKDNTKFHKALPSQVTWKQREYTTGKGSPPTKNGRNISGLQKPTTVPEPIKTQENPTIHVCPTGQGSCHAGQHPTINIAPGAQQTPWGHWSPKLYSISSIH